MCGCARVSRLFPFPPSTATANKILAENIIISPFRSVIRSDSCAFFFCAVSTKHFWAKNCLDFYRNQYFIIWFSSNEDVFATNKFQIRYDSMQIYEHMDDATICTYEPAPDKTAMAKWPVDEMLCCSIPQEKNAHISIFPMISALQWGLLQERMNLPWFDNFTFLPHAILPAGK